MTSRYEFVFLIALCFLLTINGCTKQEKRGTPANMRCISAGEFTMGAIVEQANLDQKPAHAVHLNAYYIDIHEVTNMQYEEFILAGGYKKKEFWTEEGWNFIQKNQIDKPLALGRKLFNAPNQPVVGVSWYEANAYATWAGKRLPSEAEWEKAARGIDKRIYPWGNQMDFSRLAYQCNNGIRTAVDGSFPTGASPYGVMDMAGNAWEWIADCYSETHYSRSPERNPKGPTTGEFKVLRGGSWGSNRTQMQCTYRYYAKPEYRGFNIGFRCVYDVQ